MTETKEKILQDVVTKAREKSEMEGKTQVKVKSKEYLICDNCKKPIICKQHRETGKQGYLSLQIIFCSTECVKKYLFERYLSVGLVNKTIAMAMIKKDLDMIME